MAQETTSFEEYDKKTYEWQVAALRLNGSAVVTNLKNMKRTFISVSLEGSNVAASLDGKLIYDKDDKRGYFCDQIDVELSIGSPYKIGIDSPQTTMGSESTSTSSQWQLDVNAGTFGPVPTTGVSGGIVIGSSFSKGLQDWKVVNTSTNDVIRHSYRMAASERAAYEQPSDLVDQTASGQFQGCPLYHVPDISVANMPLLTTGIFVSDRLQDRSRVNLQVKVTGHFVRVEKTFEFFVVDIETLRKPWTWQYSVPVTIPAAD